MSLKLYMPASARRVERPNIAQRVAAGLALTGLVLAWAVVLVPCALWLGCTLVLSRLAPPSARQQA